METCVKCGGFQNPVTLDEDADPLAVLEKIAGYCPKCGSNTVMDSTILQAFDEKPTPGEVAP